MISIAMATYNGERFLKQQLDSLSNQVQMPSELVVCDDVSTDGTVEIIKRFSETAPFPVRLYFNSNRLGYRENFLKAASLCTSDCIAFCDQDDIWLKDKISVVSRYMTETDCTLLQHRYRLIDDNGNVISGDMNYDFVKRHAPWRHSGGLAQVFRRSLLNYLELWQLSKDHNVDDDKMAHDQWIFFLSFVLGKTIYVEDVLSLYRQHSGNVVGFDQPLRSSRPIDLKGTLLVNASRMYGSGTEFKIKRDEVIWIVRHRVEAAAARAEIIRQLMARLSDNQANGLQIHLQFYREAEKYWSGRLSAFVSATKGERLRAMLSVFGQGLYRAQGRQGIRDAAVDMMYGVMY